MTLISIPITIGPLAWEVATGPSFRRELLRSTGYYVSPEKLEIASIPRPPSATSCAFALVGLIGFIVAGIFMSWPYVCQRCGARWHFPPPGGVKVPDDP